MKKLKGLGALALVMGLGASAYAASPATPASPPAVAVPASLHSLSVAQRDDFCTQLVTNMATLSLMEMAKKNDAGKADVVMDLNLMSLSILWADQENHDKVSAEDAKRVQAGMKAGTYPTNSQTGGYCADAMLPKMEALPKAKREKLTMEALHIFMKLSQQVGLKIPDSSVPKVLQDAALKG
jgi:hypothetical protein